MSARIRPFLHIKSCVILWANVEALGLADRVIRSKQPELLSDCTGDTEAFRPPVHFLSMRGKQTNKNKTKNVFS